eukprot:Sspe_Gene.8945::Locus_3009_Transcript_1_1_Confidence_1.000_Length_3269::g.8945::m.8945
MELLERSAVNDVKGVNDVPVRLRHLLPLPVPNHSVQVDVGEGQLVLKLKGGHHHAGNPEKEDVVTRLQKCGGEELLEVRVLTVRPPQGGVGEEPRAEPRVQNVLILPQLQLRHLLVRESELRLRLFPNLLLRFPDDPILSLIGADGLPLNRTLVRGDAVAPPQLPGDAPRLDVPQPVGPDLPVGLVRNEAERLVLFCFQRPLCHLGAVAEPLWHEERLNDVLRPLAQPDAHFVGLDVNHEILLLQGLDDGLPAVEALHPEELPLHADHPLRVHHADLGKVVALPALEVVGVVGRCDLNNPRPEVLVNQLAVKDDGDVLVTEGALDVLPVEVLVPLVLGVDGNRGVPQDGLGTGSRNLQLLPRLRNDVAEVVHQTHLDGLVVPWDTDTVPLGAVLVLNLEVRDGGLQGAAPVDQPRGAFDDAPLMELAERLDHRVGPRFVEGEELTGPIQRRPSEAQLVPDRPPVLLLPLPDLLDKLLTANVVAAGPRSSPAPSQPEPGWQSQRGPNPESTERCAPSSAATGRSNLGRHW